MPMPSKVALVGGSGRDEMLQVIANLLVPHRGSVSIAGHDLSDLTEAVTGRRIGYVGPVSYIFNDTIAGNMFYGLRHRPLHVVERDSDAESEWHRELREAVASPGGDHFINNCNIYSDFRLPGCEMQEVRISGIRISEVGSGYHADAQS